jgi:hypothetical protein
VRFERTQQIIVERRERIVRIVPTRRRTQGNPNRHLEALLTARTGRTQLAVDKFLHRLQKHACHVMFTGTTTPLNRTPHGLQLCSRSRRKEHPEVSHHPSCRVVLISGIARRKDIMPADTDRASTIGKKRICRRR